MSYTSPRGRSLHSNDNVKAIVKCKKTLKDVKYIKVEP